MKNKNPWALWDAVIVAGMICGWLFIGLLATLFMWGAL